jgi:two-component system, OmpR family, sensor kinase
MFKALKIESVRGRLTLYYVSVLAAALAVVGVLIYILLARALFVRVDETLAAGLVIAATSLSNDLEEGQDYEDAARSTVAEQGSPAQMLAIYDRQGRLLAESRRDPDLDIVVPAVGTLPDRDALLQTVLERDGDDRHRLAWRTVSLPAAEYIVVVGADLDPMDEELGFLRGTLAYVMPIALVVAGIGGSFLARRSLSPVVAMADRARRIGVENLSERLPVANARDELGHLAETFNELLARLEASLVQQRQFMADASHELRTPVTTTRTAAAVALQQEHRDETEYRETLKIVEEQAARLSRVVDDLFTLARADAGSYPVRSTPMYLDEVVDEVVRAARVVAATREVSMESAVVPSAAFTGDEELVRRMIGNLVDNAVRHAPPGSTVRVELDEAGTGFAIAVKDQGAGVPAEIRALIFERFFRGDMSRRSLAQDGAGLGLALARWIARAHGGDVVLARSSPSGSTFVISLPSRLSPVHA